MKGDCIVSRTSTPDPKWVRLIEEKRDSPGVNAPGQESLIRFLWIQGLGPVASARIIDWYATCHPEVIRSRKGE
jgi:hypothetical protein